MLVIVIICAYMAGTALWTRRVLFAPCVLFNLRPMKGEFELGCVSCLGVAHSGDGNTNSRGAFGNESQRIWVRVIVGIVLLFVIRTLICSGCALGHHSTDTRTTRVSQTHSKYVHTCAVSNEATLSVRLH